MLHKWQSASSPLAEIARVVFVFKQHDRASLGGSTLTKTNTSCAVLNFTSASQITEAASVSRPSFVSAAETLQARDSVFSRAVTSVPGCACLDPFPPRGPTAFFEYKEDGGRFPNPPSYNVATTLPSYDEAERSKEEATVPLVAGRVVVRLSPLLKNKPSVLKCRRGANRLRLASLRLGGRLCGQG